MKRSIKIVQRYIRIDAKDINISIPVIIQRPMIGKPDNFEYYNIGFC